MIRASRARAAPETAQRRYFIFTFSLPACTIEKQEEMDFPGGGKTALAEVI
jgi:hypothetical protein